MKEVKAKATMMVEEEKSMVKEGNFQFQNFNF